MNLADIIANHARRRPDHPAIIEDGRTIDYAEFDGLMRGWAAHLRAQGVGPGDIVGVNLKDSADHVIALYAIARLGAVIMPMDWRWSREEKERLAGFFDARLVLCEPGDEAAGPWTKAIIDPAWRDAVENADGDAGFPEGGNPPLVLSLSSGTTGTPKGPLITHDQMFARFMIYFVSLGFNERTRFLCAQPLYFGGSRGYAMVSLFCGATVVMHPLPYEVADLASTARDERISHLFLVPTVLRRVLDLPRAEDGERLLGDLQCLFSTGAMLHPEERADLQARICSAYLNFYGSTDGGGCTALMPDDPDDAASSVGRPVFGTTLEIVDDGHAALPAGEIGRIRYRSGGTASGYYNNEAESADAFHDGWYYPGDLGWLDGRGYLHLAGRANDMIIRGGVNIYPAEIEHVLATHPAIYEAAVVGCPSRELGQEVAAFVVTREGAGETDEAALRAFCREHLARYKVPRAVRFVDELPKSPIGKVLKNELADLL